MKKILTLSLVTAFSINAISASVKAGKIGVDFSYAGTMGLYKTNGTNAMSVGTPTIGVLWHITDMIALAPQVGFLSTGSEDKSGVNAAGTGNIVEKSTTAWGAGLEVPIYLTKFNALNFYLAPGFGYTPTSTTTKTTSYTAGTVGTTTETKSKGDYFSGYLAVGLQIPVNDQLHVFGKTTIGYASGTTNGGGVSEKDSTESFFGIQRWAVGAIFYFN